MGGVPQHARSRFIWGRKFDGRLPAMIKCARDYLHLRGITPDMAGQEMGGSMPKGSRLHLLPLANGRSVDCRPLYMITERSSLREFSICALHVVQPRISYDVVALTALKSWMMHTHHHVGYIGTTSRAMCFPNFPSYLDYHNHVHERVQRDRTWWCSPRGASSGEPDVPPTACCHWA
jgi:hypothetical protein